jgi:hypothetical protein
MSFFRLLPLIVFALPLLAVNLSWWISTAHATVPACVPYLEGCTSISAAGRHPPASFLFRGTMIPTAVLTGVFWLLVHQWLRVLGAPATLRLSAIRFFGVVGSAFLVPYVVFLGSDGEFYELMRRYGVNVFFAFTYLAQVLTAGYLDRHAEAWGLPRWLPRAKIGLAAALLLLGLASLPLSEWVLDEDALHNVVEWNLSALLVVYYVLTYIAWRRTGFELELRAGASGGAMRSDA